MHTKKLFQLVFVFFIIPFSVFTKSTAEEVKTDNPISHQIVTINADRGIDPTVVTASPGTTIVWINNSNQRLQLKFTEQKVSVSCNQPVNFILNEENVYISNQIPLGSVASLCFVQKGEFKYKLFKTGAAREPFSGTEKERFSGVIKIQ